MAPHAVIVSPAPGGAWRRNAALEIWGWAWADDGVARVDISADGGESWSAAALEPREDRSWQRFAMSWRPAASGPITLSSRATSVGGATQPAGGARNAIYGVNITIE